MLNNSQAYLKYVSQAGMIAIWDKKLFKKQNWQRSIIAPHRL